MREEEPELTHGLEPLPVLTPSSLMKWVTCRGNLLVAFVMQLNTRVAQECGKLQEDLGKV